MRAAIARLAKNGLPAAWADLALRPIPSFSLQSTGRSSALTCRLRTGTRAGSNLILCRQYGPSGGPAQPMRGPYCL